VTTSRETPDAPVAELTPRGRWLVVATAFLGWMWAGVAMSVVPLAGREISKSFLGPDAGEEAVSLRFSWYVCAFLLGAAAGGLLFGWLGDRYGRSKAMGWSILCYSMLAAATWFVTSPEQFTVMWFLVCLGVGGMWPNGVALASEAWPNVSRPMLSGWLGTSANIGFILQSSLLIWRPITADNWRWVLAVTASAVVLGLFVLIAVPESPRWKRRRETAVADATPARQLSPAVAVFLPPHLRYTLLGMVLGAVPMMGNWGSANWLVPWAGKVAGEQLHAMPDDTSQAESLAALKAWTQWLKSAGGAVGALVGGWVAARFGRRLTYFAISLASLAFSWSLFRHLPPGHELFPAFVFGIGFFGTLYFGWLPLCLPEFFPTSVRATGTGVSFNFGRIATAVGTLGTGQLMQHYGGDYARMGQVTCLVYVVGMVAILFAPDTSRKGMVDE
jgi:MFS family permease